MPSCRWITSDNPAYKGKLMNLLDFETLLVLLTLITGLTVGWNWVRRGREKAERDETATTGGKAVSWWVDLARSLFPVLLIVVVIRSFIVEPFRIPSGSMIPTLLVGDFILVNKFDYGIRLPVLHTKIFDIGEPKRGDVAVFRYPVNPSEDYIKRVIGLPGDHVVYRDKHLIINGKPEDQLLLGRYQLGEDRGALLEKENLGGVEHKILIHPENPAGDFEFDVPAGQYFMMGDNRDRSSDSRYWGTVPEQNLVGKAFLIWMSIGSAGKWINWSRIGDTIQ